MHSHLGSYLWLPLAITVAEVIVAVLVLHGSMGRAMRARGMTWRVQDTMLISPLLLIGLFLFFASLNHGMLRFALDSVRGDPDLVHLAETIAAAAVGLVIAWFGSRAVGKLY